MPFSQKLSTLALTLGVAVFATSANAAPVILDFTLDLAWKNYSNINTQYPINGFLTSAGLPTFPIQGGYSPSPRSTITGSLTYDPDGTYTTSSDAIHRTYRGAITNVTFNIGSVQFEVTKPAATNTGGGIATTEGGLYGVGVSANDRITFDTRSVMPPVAAANNRYLGSTADFSYQIRSRTYDYRIGVSDFIIDLEQPGLLDSGIDLDKVDENLNNLTVLPASSNAINRAQIIFLPFNINNKGTTTESATLDITQATSYRGFELDGYITSLSLRTQSNGGSNGSGNNVPEPGSLALLGLGLAGLAGLRRRKVH